MISAWKRYNALVLIAGCCLGILGCPGKVKSPKQENKPAATAPITNKEPGVSGIFSDYRIEYADNGLWSAKMESVSLDSKKRQLTITGIECTLYQQAKPALRVQADRGTAVYEGENAMRLSLNGKVKATSITHGQHLQTDEFRWSSVDDRIIATNLRWSGSGFSARADRGSFSTDLQHSKLSGNVHFRLPGDE